jgi:hypothetical protein
MKWFSSWHNSLKHILRNIIRNRCLAMNKCYKDKNNRNSKNMNENCVYIYIHIRILKIDFVFSVWKTLLLFDWFFFCVLQEREKQNQEEKAFEKQIKSKMKKKEQTLRAQLKVFSLIDSFISSSHICTNLIVTNNSLPYFKWFVSRQQQPT